MDELWIVVGGKVVLGADRRIRAESWCDFFVWERARCGIAGLPTSIESFELRVFEADWKYVERWFGSTGLGDSLADVSGVVARVDAE